MMSLRIRSIFAVLMLLVAAWTTVAHVRADGLADNIPENVRRIPKLGIEVPAEKRNSLDAELAQLGAAIKELELKKDAQVAELLPDVQIFWRAAHDALTYQEFFATGEIDTAIDLVRQGITRAEQLAKGEAPWATATGLIVRGYVSKIDGSVQPYGIIVPESYTPVGPNRFRLDLWFHGRGETLSEVNFLNDRQKSPGTFTPADTFVLHPYGRYNNAAKIAGEIDALEAMESVKRRYRIDDDRVTVRGFSMGGASTWQFAAHYPGMWAAANPGAGFSETPKFLKFFQQEEVHPTPWEQKLYHWYDCTDWAENFFHCPTIAYSGELDIQKQAADVMAEALNKESIELVHIIGPGTKHSYHPAAREDVERRISKLVERGRDAMPMSIRITTYTLRYNNVAWLTVDGLDEHWKRGIVHADIDPRGNLDLRTENVNAITISFAPDSWPFRSPRPPRIRRYGIPVESDANALVLGRIPSMMSDRSWKVSLHREGDTWKVGRAIGTGLLKRHLLQGPIDDAFMDSFVFVRPTGKSASAKVDAWVHAELERAIEHWRRHFRGHARVKNDRDVTDDDIANMNLVLWGDESSNSVLARIAGKLPIRRQKGNLIAAGKNYEADYHVPILIYPNPLNPNRYVVLNSSFTFRDFAYLNNARQVAKLPDWAIVDIRTPADTLWPGKIEAADFFDERWEFRNTE